MPGSKYENCCSSLCALPTQTRSLFRVFRCHWWLRAVQPRNLRQERPVQPAAVAREVLCPLVADRTKNFDFVKSRWDRMGIAVAVSPNSISMWLESDFVLVTWENEHFCWKYCDTWQIHDMDVFFRLSDISGALFCWWQSNESVGDLKLRRDSYAMEGCYIWCGILLAKVYTILQDSNLHKVFSLCNASMSPQWIVSFLPDIVLYAPRQKLLSLSLSLSPSQDVEFIIQT